MGIKEQILHIALFDVILRIPVLKTGKTQKTPQHPDKHHIAAAGHNVMFVRMIDDPSLPNQRNIAVIMANLAVFEQNI